MNNTITIGMDLGDKFHIAVVFDADGNELETAERDARMLGMVCRIEPRLLHPLWHRGSQAQADLAAIKSRDILVQNRTKLINHTRGIVNVKTKEDNPILRGPLSGRDLPH